MKTTMKRQTKTEVELLDHATNNLLRALKQDMRKKNGRVDYNKLKDEFHPCERCLNNFKNQFFLP